MGEITVYEALNKFNEDVFNESKKQDLIVDFTKLSDAGRENNRVRPKYHEVAQFVLEHRKEDTVDIMLLALTDICSELDEISNPSLVMFFEKVIDHIQLEQLRMNVIQGELIGQLQENKKQVASLDEHITLAEENITCIRAEIDADVKHVRKEVKDNKFDMIALATLVFSAFSMLQVNLTLFAAFAGQEHSLNLVVALMAMVNIIIITSIIAIYSVIRKIHGDIGDEALYYNIFSLLVILIFTGLFGYYVFPKT